MADQDIAGQWATFSPERRQTLLQKMTPEQKKYLRTQLESSTATAAPVATSTATATGPEPRTFRNYASEAIRGVGRGVVNDIQGLVQPEIQAAQNIRHPIQSAKDMQAQAEASADAIKTAYGESAAGTPMQRAAATGLAVLENAPVVGGLVQRAEAGGTKLASPESVGAAAEGITSIAAPEVIGRGLSSAGRLRAKAAGVARSAGQQVAGAGRGVVAEAVRSAAEKAAQDTAVRPEEIRAHGEKVRETTEHNTKVERDTNRKEALSRGLEEGSKRVGDEIKALDKTVRGEANSKYAEVRKAVGDATVSAADLATDVTAAEGKLRGSQESIKVFRDILANAPQGEQFVVSGGTKFGPGSNLFEDVMRQEGPKSPVFQGGESEAKPVAFADLQGYYTELGDKLATGNLPGDVYQAMKTLRESIGKRMQGLADQKGVGPQFREAQSFYHNYMDTFHEPTGPSGSGSPVAQSLRALDPENIRAPFTGKAGSRGVEMLAKYDPELAKRVRQVARAQEEHDSIKPESKKELPVLKAKEETPTVNLRKVRADAIRSKAGKFGLTGYDAAIAGSTMLQPLIHALGGAGEAFRATAGTYIFSKLMAQKMLENPRVVDWLSQPTPKDLELIRNVPGAQRVKIVGAIDQIAQQAKARGMAVSPAVLALVAGGAGAIQNRKEALARLPASPASHVFHVKEWQSHHPGEDEKRAIAEAQRQGYTVVQ